MKKNFTYVLATIVIIYSIVWFVAANRIEKEVYNTLDNLKTEGKIKKYSTDISVSGFPFSFDVKFTSPSVTFDTGDVNSEIVASFKGNIEAKAGLFSRYFTVTTLGDAYLKGNIEDYEFDIISEGNRLSTYQLKLSNLPVSPFFIAKVKAAGSSSDKTDYLKLIEGFKIDERAFTAYDRITNRTFATSTRVLIDVDGEIFSDKKDFKVLTIVDMLKFFDESLKVWSHLQKLPIVNSIKNSLNKDIINYFEVFSLNELGSMHYKIDLSYEDDGNEHYINVKQFNIRDDLYVIDAKSKGSFSSDAVKGNLKATILCSDDWHTLMVKYINKINYTGNIIDINYSNESILGLIFNPVTGFLNTLLKKNDHGKYVPHLNQVGPIKIDTDLSYKKKNDEQFDLNVKNFSLNTRTYFVNLEGNLIHKSEKDIYDIKADLGNYLTIVDQSVEYINRLSSAGDYRFKVLGGGDVISSSISSKIKRFMRNVSNNPSSQSQDLKLTIRNTGDTIYPAVGSYTSAEFKQAWQSFVASIIIDKVASKVGDILEKGGKSVENGLKGNILGSVKDITEGVLGILN